MLSSAREVKLLMLRILLAEDDCNHAALARQTLEDDGHIVTAVSDGRAALETVGRQHFDLLLLDMRLPEMDGRECIGRIRGADAAFAKIPIVVVTGYGLRQHLDYFNRHGVRHYLSKPYDCDELSSIVSSYDLH